MRHLIFLTAFVASLSVSAQNVGINNPAPDPSALLDLTSTGQGLLIPRMTSGERDAIPMPATSLLIWNATTVRFEYFDGTAWVPFATGWGLQGNSGTDPATNFIGTTDNQPLVLRTNDTEQVRVLTTGNVGIGTNGPTTRLHVEGQVRITGGNPGAGKVLTSDAAGTATWQEVVLPMGTTPGEMLYWDGTTWALLPPPGTQGQLLAYCENGPVWTTAGICSRPGPSITDIDGNTYTTVIIGTQVWMAENLRTTRCADGTPIPNVTDNAAWAALNTGAWAHYDNNVGHDAVYGKLYNGHAIAGCNVCPTGWHVPTRADWSVLARNVGGHSNMGDHMKTTGTIEDGTGLWTSPNPGATNASGFSAVPGGRRHGYLNVINGAFADIGTNATLWSSTQTSTIGFLTVSLTNGAGSLAMGGAHIANAPPSGSISGPGPFRSGHSVRCIQD